MSSESHLEWLTKVANENPYLVTDGITKVICNCTDINDVLSELRHNKSIINPTIFKQIPEEEFSNVDLDTEHKYLVLTDIKHVSIVTDKPKECLWLVSQMKKKSQLIKFYKQYFVFVDKNRTITRM